MSCTLCLNTQTSHFFEDSKRSWVYLECSKCRLVFRDPKSYLGPSEEKARYQTHNNSIENLGYVKFLSPVVDTLIPVLEAGDVGLDFGCGPGPILDQLFDPHGVKVLNYDPYFYNDPELLAKAYDFVTCTEAFEHFYRPGDEMDKLYELVKSGGYLLLMTEKRKDLPGFEAWGYRTDNTHVCFLNNETLDWMSAKWHYELIFTSDRLTLFKKK